MVQLTAFSQNNEEINFLDLDEVSIKATFSSVEIQDITQQKSDFTQSFTLPFTETNNNFFEHYYEVNADSESFNVDSKTRCEIYIDSNIQFKGYLQLLSVDVTNGIYNVNAFGDIANLSREIGEDLLSDLDLSDYNHVLSRTNIFNSWDGSIEYTGSQPDGDEILYPIIDFGQEYNSTTLNTNAGAIKPRNLKPAIKLKTVFDKIVNNAGYTINSNFLDSNFFTSQYMTLANEVEGAITQNQDSLKVGKTSFSTITANADTTIPFNDESAANGFYDTNNNWSTVYYTAPVTGAFGFRLVLCIHNLNLVNGSADLKIQVNSGTPALITTINLSSAVEYDVINTVMDYAISADINDQIRFIITNNTGSNFYVTASHTFGTTLFRSFVELTSAPDTVEGGTVDMSVGNNLLPQETQIDFIRSILSRYNLIVEQDKDTTNQLNIEPFQIYIDAGTSKDWTEKLDLSKSVVLEPTNKFRNANIRLTDLEDDDRVNKYFQEIQGKIYNSYHAELQGDFGQGDLEIPTIFSSFAPINIPNTLLFIAQHFEYNNGAAEYVTTKPKLFYYSGTKDLPPASEYKVFSETTDDYVTKDAYPFCHHYAMSGNNVVSTDSDIRFKSEFAFNLNGLVDTQTGNDVYSLYWKNYIDGIYDKNAKVLTAYFKLNSVDIANFKFNDKVFIKDAYYRINKIDSYAIGAEVSTRVELIKLLNVTSSDICNYTIDSYNIDGTTSWINSSGASVTPTASCCESEGLYFNNDSCFWNIIQNDEPAFKPPATYTDANNSEISVGDTSSVVNVDSDDLYIKSTVRQIGKAASDGQVLKWNSTLNSTDWGDVSAATADAIKVSVRFKEAVSKGDPCYIDTYNQGQAALEVYIAKANDKSKMPSIGLADADYSQNDDGHLIQVGSLTDVDTSSFSEGDIVYVAPTGGLTNTRPTGANEVQNVGIVGRSQQNNGEIYVTAIGRANDVPNQITCDSVVTTGSVTVGDDLNVDTKITNTGTDSSLTVESDGDLTFTIDRDNDESGKKFIFKDYNTEIAELDDRGNLQVDGLMTGKQRVVYSQSFLDDVGTATRYLPWKDINEQTSIFQEEAAMVMPCDGRITSISLRASSVTGTGTITMSIHSCRVGISQFSTGNWVTEETEAITVSSTDDFHLFHFGFSDQKHFNAGELVSISIRATSAISGNTYWYATTAVELDWNTYIGTTSANYGSNP